MWYRRNAIGWCSQDNVPLLGARCDLCQSEGKPIPVSWRGEIRPLSFREATLYNKLLQQEYGIQPLCGLDGSNHTCHWVEDVHRNQHIANVISGGEVILRVFYSPDSLWRLAPTVHFVRAYQPPAKTVEVSAWDIVRRRSIRLSAKAPYLLLQAGNLVAVAQIDDKANGQEDQKYHLKGLGKIYHPIGIPSSLEAFVQANQSILTTEIAKKRTRLRRVLEEYPDKPILVSLSGGKDSSVTLDIVANAGLQHDREIRAVFLDTRNEFTETTNLIPQLRKHYSKKIQIDTVRTPFDFFALWSRLGPPSWENRWCCKTQKFLPLAEYLEKRFPSGVVTLSGTRGMESLRRERRLFQEEKLSASANPYLQRQVVEVPLIGDWSSLTVWLYLLTNKVPFNPLYLEGLHRLGCWACPAAPLTYFVQLREYRPALFQSLLDRLCAASEQTSVDDGLEIIQRWKSGELSRIEKLDVEHSDGRVVINDKTPGLAQFVTPLVIAGLDVSVSCTQVSVPNKKGDIGLLERQLKRALYCVRCTKCVSLCPVGAITVTRRVYHIDRIRCTGCLECVEAECPALGFEVQYAEG